MLSSHLGAQPQQPSNGTLVLSVRRAALGHFVLNHWSKDEVLQGSLKDAASHQSESHSCALRGQPPNDSPDTGFACPLCRRGQTAPDRNDDRSSEANSVSSWGHLASGLRCAAAGLGTGRPASSERGHTKSQTKRATHRAWAGMGAQSNNDQGPCAWRSSFALPNKGERIPQKGALLHCTDKPRGTAGDL